MVSTVRKAAGCGCLVMIGLFVLAAFSGGRQHIQQEVRQHPLESSPVAVLPPAAPPAAVPKAPETETQLVTPVNEMDDEPSLLVQYERMIASEFADVPPEVMERARLIEEQLMREEIDRRERWWIKHRSRIAGLSGDTPRGIRQLNELGDDGRKRRDWETRHPVYSVDEFRGRLKTALERIAKQAEAERLKK